MPIYVLLWLIICPLLISMCLTPSTTVHNLTKEGNNHNLPQQDYMGPLPTMYMNSSAEWYIADHTVYRGYQPYVTPCNS